MSLTAYYLTAINLISFVTVFADKQNVKKHKHRISEKTIFILALTGGSLGVLVSMHVFRHKTKKWYFKAGIPFIIIIQILIASFLITS